MYMVKISKYPYYLQMNVWAHLSTDIQEKLLVLMADWLIQTSTALSRAGVLRCSVHSFQWSHVRKAKFTFGRYFFKK